MSQHYGFVQKNGRTIQITISEQEYQAQKAKARRAMIAQERAAEERRLGISPGVTVICPNCGSKRPSSYVTRSGDWYCKHCGWAPKTYKGGPKA